MSLQEYAEKKRLQRERAAELRAQLASRKDNAAVKKRQAEMAAKRAALGITTSNPNAPGGPFIGADESASLESPPRASSPASSASSSQSPAVSSSSSAATSSQSSFAAPINPGLERELRDEISTLKRQVATLEKKINWMYKDNKEKEKKLTKQRVQERLTIAALIRSMTHLTGGSFQTELKAQLSAATRTDSAQTNNRRKTKVPKPTRTQHNRRAAALKKKNNTKNKPAWNTSTEVDDDEDDQVPEPPSIDPPPSIPAFSTETQEQEQEQEQHETTDNKTSTGAPSFDDMPVGGNKQAVSFDDMPVGGNNQAKSFDDIPVGGGSRAKPAMSFDFSSPTHDDDVYLDNDVKGKENEESGSNALDELPVGAGSQIDYDEEALANAEKFTCKGCERSFIKSAYAKHRKICKKVFQKKRKKFKVQVVEERVTLNKREKRDLAKRMRKAKAEKERNGWRAQRAQLREAMKAARQAAKEMR